MLTNLHISNIVLIDKLNLEFGAVFNVLTGETGAGKSILLDALALALGARSDTGLIRHGCDTANVIAEFQISNQQSAIRNVLEESGIEPSETITLRRTLSADGKSRAWVNDVPVSVKVLKQIGDCLAEIHGQFENHSLLDQTTHRATLDEFGSYNDLRNDVRAAYEELHSAEKRLRELNELLEKSAAEREFLEHNVKELAALKPLAGEEDELATQRAQLMDAEKNAAILADAAAVLNPKGQGLDAALFNAAHILERIKSEPNPYQSAIDKLYEIAESLSEISAQIAPLDTDTASLESIEERLFAIRAAARKHRCAADELPEKLERMTEQLNAIDNSDAELKRLQSEVGAKKNSYDKFAARLTRERVAAAGDLRAAILRELPDLKLGQADFMVEVAAAAPSGNGSDEILFMIKTNPGTPFAPLHKIASGGELARLMLAMRVAMTGNIVANESSPTLVFDEVDTGISGATASAVGERLARLAADGQALVITHSAQVAGFADNHFKIEKHAAGGTTTTTVSEISGDARLNEIARIISGEEITAESLATAKTLIKR